MPLCEIVAVVAIHYGPPGTRATATPTRRVCLQTLIRKACRDGDPILDGRNGKTFRVIACNDRVLVVRKAAR